MTPSFGITGCARGGAVLRPAGAEDCEVAFSIRKAVFKAQSEAVGGWDETEERRAHLRRFTTQDYRFVVVEDSPVGVMAVVIASDCIHLNQLFVLPSQQGKGVGGAAMKLLVEEADTHCLPVRLQVLTSNPRAFEFYSRLGFAQVCATGTHHTMVRNCGNLSSSGATLS